MCSSVVVVYGSLHRYMVLCGTTTVGVLCSLLLHHAAFEYASYRPVHPSSQKRLVRDVLSCWWLICCWLFALSWMRQRPLVDPRCDVIVVSPSLPLLMLLLLLLLYCFCVGSRGPRFACFALWNLGGLLPIFNEMHHGVDNARGLRLILQARIAHATRPAKASGVIYLLHSTRVTIH